MGNLVGGDLPKGWRVVTLGEICQEDRVTITNSDHAYKTMPYLGLEHIEPATGRVLVTKQEAQNSGSKSNNFHFTSEHVLYGKLRPYLNKVALPDFTGRCTTEMIPLKPISVDRVWLAWLLRRPEVVEHAMRGKTGSRMPRASMGELLAMRVAVPPRREQRRIVTRIESQITIAHRIHRATKDQLNKVAAMSQALLQRPFPKPSTKRLPQDWRWSPLGEVVEIVNGSTPNSSESKFWDGSICWITPADLGQLEGAYIQRSTRTITKAGFESCSTRLVPTGAVVMSSRAPIGHLGVAAVPLCTNQGCKSFVPTPAIETGFLYHALRWALDDIRALGSGATFPEVGKKKLADFKIPLPSLSQQRHIATWLDSSSATLARVQAAAQAQLKTVDAFAQVAVQQAFQP